MAVASRVSDLVDIDQAAYAQAQLAADLEVALAKVLRFDLVPSEFATLPGEGILALAGTEIIHMGSGTVYYRDHPDFYFADNLLALEHYRFIYQPPP